MRRALLTAALLAPLAAQAGSGAAPVIGGTDAPAGKYPDVTATMAPDGLQECTGTLVAPTVVLTADHCIDSGFGGRPASPAAVVVGTASLARKSDGDILQVSARTGYPNGGRTYDVGVLVLAQPSRMTPRPLATGWASLDIKDGAAAIIAGYGAIDRNSTMFVNELQEAETVITDAGCTSSAGCNSLAQPNGELGAGGMGIDTCPGDSGGPLYLVTSYGTFLAGVTSRGYDDNQYDCSEGGIYARPDKIADWIEETAGVKVARGPEPTYEPLVAVRGHAAETTIDPNDPLGGEHRFEITTPPAYGTAAIREDGRLRVCTDAGVAGSDDIVVTITDADDSKRALTVRMPIEITDGDAGSDCDPDDFGETGGCCDAGRSASGSVPLAAAVLLMLRRRRR